MEVATYIVYITNVIYPCLAGTNPLLTAKPVTKSKPQLKKQNTNPDLIDGVKFT